MAADTEDKPVQSWGWWPFAGRDTSALNVDPDIWPGAFLPSVALPVLDDTASINLAGHYGPRLMLAAGCDTEEVRWELTAGSATGDLTAVEGSLLFLDDLSTNVHKARIMSATTATAPFWIAKPANTAPVDRYLPTGRVHAEFLTDNSHLRLHITGRAYDAIQSALCGGGHGLGEAYLVVDGVRVDVELASTGDFSVEADVTPDDLGFHTVELFAADMVHSQPVRIDAEFVSEHYMRFDEVVSADPRHWRSAGFMMTAWNGVFGKDYLLLPAEAATAIATPRLDDKGLLVLDGTESLNAQQYNWTAENVVSGETIELGHEAVAGTEDMPAGLYMVTLDVQGYWFFLSAPDQVTSFLLLVPPRIPFDTRDVMGSIHLRWTSEYRDNGYIWVLHLAGYVFDEIGLAALNYPAADTAAWVTINGTRHELSLDANGEFMTSVEIGPTVEDEYVITLYAAPPGLAAQNVDTLRPAYLSIFQPPSTSTNP